MPSGIYEHKKGYKRPELSKKMIGKKLSEERRRQMSLGRMGMVFSDKHRKNISISHLGKHHPNSGFQKGNHPRTEFRKGHNFGVRFGRDKLSVGGNHWNWKDGITKNMKYYYQRRRSLMMKGGKLSIRKIQRVYEDNIKKHGTLTCYLCLNPIEFGQDSLEHKIPITRGGNNKYDNLAIAHLSCNQKKQNKTEDEYRLWVMNKLEKEV